MWHLTQGKGGHRFWNSKVCNMHEISQQHLNTLALMN